MNSPIPYGGFRLFYNYPNSPAAHDFFQDFQCLDKALNYSGHVYEWQGEPKRLLNWMGERACPDDQLMGIAKLRSRALGLKRQEEHRRLLEEKMRSKADEELQANPLYGMF